jgi:hypothetical protein
MKQMPYAPMFAAMLFACVFFIACDKEKEEPVNQRLAGFTDSVNALLGKWTLIKDSSTNIGGYFFVEGGIPYSPTPGVYMGTAADYWDFKSNGTVSMHGNNNHYTSDYYLQPNNKINIKEMLLIDTANLLTFTETQLTFDFKASSSNGGIYYRRVYLKK